MQKKSRYYYALATIFLGCFVLFAVLLQSKHPSLNILDKFLTDLIRMDMSIPITRLFKGITTMGNTATLAVIILLFGCWLAIKKDWSAIALFFFNTAIIGGCLNLTLKHLFNRPRPSLTHLVYAAHSSFPSGHSMGSMLTYGTLLLLLPLFIRQKLACRLIQLTLACLVVLIGISRVYVGVHYPSDVLAGFSLGLSGLFATYPTFLYFRKKM